MEDNNLPTPIPERLKKYIVEQNYERYTWEDQAVWRYVLRQLRNHLSVHGHSSYMAGLEKTGVTIESIPRIEEMDVKLSQLGWRAIPVSGFIPPAAFMELQSLGYLPIACDIRRKEHILYTPAPDIVHEAAGHAPIIVNEEYANYLHRYAEVANKSLLSKEDLDIYSVIRKISDLKEEDETSYEEINRLEALLNDLTQKIAEPSEASLVSRMNWWTAEYGLIVENSNIKIYGAGLLSSIGESRSCLFDNVEKIPLTSDCVNVNYDITRPQPQLFYVENFQQLNDVLDSFAKTMAFSVGGLDSVNKAIRCKTVSTIELDSGLQISGVIVDSESLPGGDQPTFIRFAGPTQVSFANQQLEGHGKDYHSHGYSSPLGPISGMATPLNECTKEELSEVGIMPGSSTKLEFLSGFIVEGVVEKIIVKNDKPILISFSNCTVSKENKIYFEPEWGIFDMAIGEKINSVFGGPADYSKYGEIDSFTPQFVKPKAYSQGEEDRFDFYKRIRDLRNNYQPLSDKLELMNSYIEEFYNLAKFDWLLGVEILELMFRLNMNKARVQEFENYLKTQPIPSNSENSCMLAGIQLADFVL